MINNKLKSIFQLFSSKYKYSVIIVLTTITLLTLTVYWPVVHNDFILIDDSQYVTDNKNVTLGVTLENIIWAFSSIHSNNWHPLTWISHMLDCQLFGVDAGMHHLMNLLFHTLNTLLLFIIFYRMTGQIWQCAFIAMLFGLHPLHVESVAWVSERKDVLSTFFWMLVILFYISYTKNRSLAKYMVVFILCLAAFMTKPMVITLPAILLLLDYWPLKRFKFRQENHADLTAGKVNCLLIYEKVPLIILAIMLLVVTLVAQRTVSPESLIITNLYENIPLNLRVANAFLSYIKYIVSIFFPFNLAILYPHPDHISMFKTVSAVLVLFVVTIYFFYKLESRPYLLFGWLWYIITITPVIGFIQFGMHAMADRYTYIPSIGIFIIITWGGAEIIRNCHYKKIIASSLALVLMILLLICTRIQLSYWKDSKTLFLHAIEVTKNNASMHNDLGYIYTEESNIDKALFHFSEALKINPSYTHAHFNIGCLLGDINRQDEAIWHLKEVLKVNPHCEPAHRKISFMLLKQGKTAEAITHCEKALLIDPLNPETHNNFGMALLHQGKVDEAIRHFHIAKQILPDSKAIQDNLNYALKAIQSQPSEHKE